MTTSIRLLEKHFYHKVVKNLEETLEKSQRPYIFMCVDIEINHKKLKFAIPFRSHISEKIIKIRSPRVVEVTLEKYVSGDACGLDFRKAILITDINQIGITSKISQEEFKYVKRYESLINKRFQKYVEAYIKRNKKNLNKVDFKFLYSTLKNYHNELGI